MSSRSRRVRIERLLLAIMVHGPSVIHERVEELRRLRATDKAGYREVKAFWKERQSEEPHEGDCACWDCLDGLRREVLIFRAYGAS